MCGVFRHATPKHRGEDPGSFARRVWVQLEAIRERLQEEEIFVSKM